jgi:hypothetical protein
VNNSFAARTALPFALVLGVAEIARNWGDWGFWPFWLVDYIAVALLAWAWRAASMGQPRAGSRLAGAWGFTCAMFYMSFFSHLATIQSADHGPINHRWLTAIIGVMFAVTIASFVSALRTRA